MTEIEKLREQNKRVLEKLELLVSSNQDLENQLKEKDKEIEKLKNSIELVSTQKDNLYKSYDEKLKPLQEKTDFAIEQLEKVKDFIRTNNLTMDRLRNLNFIDNQIKELKECSNELYRVRKFCKKS